MTMWKNFCNKFLLLKKTGNGGGVWSGMPLETETMEMS